MAVALFLLHPSVPEGLQQAFFSSLYTWFSDDLRWLYLGVEQRGFIYDMFAKAVRITEISVVENFVKLFYIKSVM
jgi:hypothetical protein